MGTYQVVVVHVFVLVGSYSVAWRLSYSNSDDNHVHATALWSVHLYDFAHPTMSCIPLVYCINTVAGCVYRYRIVHDCQYQYIAVYVDLTITLIFEISHG